MSTKTDYLAMQKQYYDAYADQWRLDFRDPVVGSYDAHNAWPDYDTMLFKSFDTTDCVALDYGTGPGRNIIKFHNRFKRIDGVDISQINLDKAVVNLHANGIEIPNLYHTTGDNLNMIEDDVYDVVFSVICLQHICSWSIRDSIFREVYRVLKPGGKFCFQMGHGGKDYPTANWRDDQFDAASTNGHSDVSIMDFLEVEADLYNIGFKLYQHDLRPTGPGDNHRNWIWIQVEK
jgi:SAM-dependent methyltransferase